MKSIYDPRYIDMISRLIATRIEASLTQAQLANRLGKPQSFVAKVENYHRRVDVAEIADWLSALNTAPAEFMEQFGWWREQMLPPVKG